MCKVSPDVSIILVSWKTRDLLLACIDSLAAAAIGLHYDVWVVDNGSQDGSLQAVRDRFPAVQVIANTANVGFAAANNQAMHASSGRYALLLNSDTVARPDAIQRLVRFADATPRAGVVGAQLIDPDGSFQASFADFPSFGSELLSATGLGSRLIFRNYPSYGPQKSLQISRVDYVPGACMLARRTAFERVGLMDEGYFMYSEETDWCMRMCQAGWETWYLPTAVIVHYGGQSTGQVRHSMLQALYRSKVRFFRKHYGSGAATLLRLMLVVLLRGRWLANLPTTWCNGSASPVISWSDLQITSP
jgi:N-acetylglucosaminyl-diphospho-decaprenol L-rhamnosyltransferase